MPSPQQLEAMLESDPDDVFLRYALAMAHRSAGDHEQAIQVFDDVLERDAEHVPSYFQKAQTLAELKKVDEARAVINDGIKVADRVNDAHAAGEMREFLALL
ncbi:tetratricopeptide repeat protein [Thalassoroseus pseudoceratinae]|uniref:tetratricopeptide repeat protein n=1 Tax=Thalassoroseus pseudoceratinae TaxID=2713176 RepID=UPI00141EA7A6|nr:CDC27 family protein [Thalassoroseus pseudoceratinae]